MADPARTHRRSLAGAYQDAYRRLLAHGVTSGDIAKAVGLTSEKRSTTPAAIKIRKMAIGTDQPSWKPKITHEQFVLLDTFCMSRVNEGFDLARLSLAYSDATTESPDSETLVQPDGPYAATMRLIRHRISGGLKDRADWIDRLVNFAISSELPERYPILWIVAEPWAGKTALMAESVEIIRRHADVVGYFLTQREGDADRIQFIRRAGQQLAYLIGADIGTVTDMDEFRSLWATAADRARVNGRPLILLVDGVDEDTLATSTSVMAAIPEVGLGHWAKIVLTTRPNFAIPVDVPIDHPVRLAPKIALKPSPHASRIRDRAEQEILWLLSNQKPVNRAVDILGALTVAAGPLTAQDLSSITGVPVTHVRKFVERQRSLQSSVNARGLEAFSFSHLALLDQCRSQPELGGDLVHINRLTRWADRWRRAGWPTTVRHAFDTPVYLLSTYPRVLASDPAGNRPLFADMYAELERLLLDQDWVDAAIVRSGVDQVIDFVERIGKSQHSGPTLVALYEMLLHERHHLRRAPSQRPGFAATQLAWEQVRRHIDPTVLRSRLTSMPGPQIIPVASTERAEVNRRVRGETEGGIQVVIALAGSRILTGTHEWGGWGAIEEWSFSDTSTPPKLWGRVEAGVSALISVGDYEVVSASGSLNGQSRIELWTSRSPEIRSHHIGDAQGGVVSLCLLDSGLVLSAALDAESEHDSETSVFELWDPSREGVHSLSLAKFGFQVKSIESLENGQVIVGAFDSPDGRTKGGLYIWDPTEPTRMDAVQANQLGTNIGAVKRLRTGPLVVWDEEPHSGMGVLRCVHFENSGIFSSVLGRSASPIESIIELADGRVATTSDDVVVLWDANLTDQHPELIGRAGKDVWALAATDDSIVVTGTNNEQMGPGALMFWSTAAVETAFEGDQEGGGARLWSGVLLDDGGVVTCGHLTNRDPVIQKWRPGSRERLNKVWELTGKPESNGIGFTAIGILDNDRIATVSGGSPFDESTLEVWDTASSYPKPIVIGHPKTWVRRLFILPDQRIVTSTTNWYGHAFETEAWSSNSEAQDASDAFLMDCISCLIRLPNGTLFVAKWTVPVPYAYRRTGISQLWSSLSNGSSPIVEFETGADVLTFGASIDHDRILVNVQDGVLSDSLGRHGRLEIWRIVGTDLVRQSLGETSGDVVDGVVLRRGRYAVIGSNFGVDGPGAIQLWDLIDQANAPMTVCAVDSPIRNLLSNGEGTLFCVTDAGVTSFALMDGSD